MEGAAETVLDDSVTVLILGQQCDRRAAAVTVKSGQLTERDATRLRLLQEDEIRQWSQQSEA